MKGALNLVIVVFGIALFMVSPLVVMGHEEFIVGDGEGWESTVNYAAWLLGKNFHKEDILVFNYNPDYSHNVIEVDQNGYENCDASSEIKRMESGNDKLTLSDSGTFYYICEAHCSYGQKIKVVVE